VKNRRPKSEIRIVRISGFGFHFGLMMPFHDTKLFNRKTLKKPAETAKINHLDAELGTRNSEMHTFANLRAWEGDTSIWFNLLQFWVGNDFLKSF